MLLLRLDASYSLSLEVKTGLWFKLDSAQPPQAQMTKSYIAPSAQSDQFEAILEPGLFLRLWHPASAGEQCL